MPQFALRIVTGARAGEEIALPEGRELVIGRLSTSDIPVEDDNVSRRHVGVTLLRGQVNLQDLESRNGTFVNRQRVAQAILDPGDLVSVGNCVFRLVKVTQTMPTTVTQHTPVVAPPPTPKFPMAPPPAVKPAAQTTSMPSPVVSGTFRGALTEIALVDVLQLLSGTRKSGLLVLRSGRETGRVFLQDGRVYYACMEQWLDVEPRKVLYRLLRWKTGTFELEKSDVRVFDNPITESTDALLLEGVRQLDELNNLGSDLPPLDATVSLATPLPGRLTELEHGDLDFLQLVLDYSTVRRILDHFPGTDCEGYIHLLGMVGRKYLKIAPPAAQQTASFTKQHG